MKNVSLKDIAQKVGTSIATVSLVLNGKGKKVRISDALSRKIKTVAKQEGYQPNKMAIGLRTGKSNIIGLIVDTISGHFFAALAEVIEREVDRYGYKVIYCSCGNEVRKGKELIRLLHQHQVDGYIIIPMAGIEKEIGELEENGKPVVLLDSYFSKTKSTHVLVDNYDGISMAVTHLIDRGYQRIAFVYNNLAMIQMKERKRAFSDTIKKAGIKTSPELILKVPLTDNRQEQVLKIKTFLDEAKPEAVLFAANYLGVQGLEAIQNLQLKIPADIGVVCFDDHELFSLHQPAITVVQQPVQELAKTAVAILMAKLGQEETASKESVELPATFVERQSTTYKNRQVV